MINLFFEHIATDKKNNRVFVVVYFSKITTLLVTVALYIKNAMATK
jgi:hypothetical protein